MAFEHERFEAVLPESHIGHVVLSLSGRDAKRIFVVIGIARESADHGAYVYLANGALRRVDKPKKKKIKHVKILGSVSDSVRVRIASGEISDKEIRAILCEFKQGHTTQNS